MLKGISETNASIISLSKYLNLLLVFVNPNVIKNAYIKNAGLPICLSIITIVFATSPFKLGKIEKCIPRLIGLICSNSSRISKFAACVLSKLAEIPSILTMIMPYEQELFVAASTDESISKVILGIISN